VKTLKTAIQFLVPELRLEHRNVGIIQVMAIDQNVA
jgi:hypothetical protein